MFTLFSRRELLPRHLLYVPSVSVTVVSLFTSPDGVTERSVVRLDGARAAKRTEHWREVVRSACEQCGRNRSPEVNEPTTFSQWVRQPDTRLRLILDPSAELSLEDLDSDTAPTEVVLAIGPEGGFAPSEVRLALDSEMKGVRFGPRVLRAETASIAALTAIQVLWGDLKR